MTDSDAELAAGRLGRTVGGRWRLESVLGVGGMAAVYGGRDASGAVAAIKILHPEMSVRREVRERFLREGYVANRIGHPGVVQALEHGETGDEVFLAMELLAGETLRSRVKRHGRLPVGEVLDYADQILDVLAVAHDKGIVHRDLKPDNLFVSPDGRIKILDFGLARVLDGVPAEHRTRTGVALGTLAYMAPEQALGRRAEIDGRVDIFALGATMFRVLSGRRVHEAESEAELLMAMASRPAPPLAAAVPGISPAIGSVVDLALAFSRDARYPDARTMQGDVRALRQGQHAAYASARMSSREEATRAEAPPTTSQRTQPLSATMASHLPGTSGTQPMPVNSLGVITTAPGHAVPVAAAPQGPPSVRTEPFAPHGVSAVVPGAAMPGPASFATTMPSTQPPFVVPAFAASQPALTPAKKSPRGMLIAVLALAFVGVALAGGAGAWYYFAGPNADAAATPAPSAPALPEAVAPPGTVATPPSEPVPTEPVAEAPGAAARKGSSNKQDAVAEPSATATASVAPTATASATSDSTPPPAPSSAGTAAPVPPTPAAPTPSAAPPTPPAPAAPATDAKEPPPPKRGRGRTKK